MKLIFLKMLIIIILLFNSDARADVNVEPLCYSCKATFSVDYSDDGYSVLVESSKDLSHVTFAFCDGSVYKYDDLNVGDSYRFELNKEFKSVKPKAGCSEEYYERKCSKVSPVLECVHQQSDKLYTAYFGYYNGNDYNVSIPVGSDNKFTPRPSNRNQTEFYNKGRFVNVFSVDFDGGNLVWSLRGKTATASRDSQKCPVDCAGVPNGDAVVDQCGICDGDGTSCSSKDLDSKVCSSVNGFLKHINIASVVNKSMVDLEFRYTYTDLWGDVQSDFVFNVLPNTKKDIIVNDNGLDVDSYGTVCIESSIDAEGLWFGGITQYRVSPESSGFGDNTDFDFALYLPFKNAVTSSQVVTLNTYRLGGSGAANWVRITDSEKDGRDLFGNLSVYETKNGVTSFKHTFQVRVRDGGRYDFPTHEYLDHDTVGFAVFLPLSRIGDEPQKFYVTASRVLYDCSPDAHSVFACEKFITAYTVPAREPSRNEVHSIVSVDDDSYNIVEINNPSNFDNDVRVAVYDENGVAVYDNVLSLSKYETRHFVVDSVLSGGGHVNVSSTLFGVNATLVQYRLSDGAVDYVVSNDFEPVVKSIVQLLQYNTYLGQINDVRVANVSSNDETVVFDVLDYNGNLVSTKELLVKAGSQSDVDLNIPKNIYGIVVVSGSNILVTNSIYNNYYLLSFSGE